MIASRVVGPVMAAVMVVGCGGRSGQPLQRSSGPEEIEEKADAVVAVEGSSPEVVFRPRGAAEARVSVEVARTERQLQQGLMHRSHLPSDTGMLFLFRRPKVQMFWMKNTFIPLDIIFVSSAMVVVGVVEDAAPKTTTRRWLPNQISQYVVEVNAGWVRAHQIAAGTPVEFVRVPPIGLEEDDGRVE